MYQPALHPKHCIRNTSAPYILSSSSDGRPMTYHARRAGEEYLARYPEIQFVLRTESQGQGGNS